MDTFRLTCQRGLFVAKKMHEAASANSLQCGLDADGGIERNRTHPDCLRRQPIGSEQSITSLDLAARLNADWRSVEQAQRHVEEYLWIAILELELDLADRRDGVALGSTDLALVNGRLDLSGWIRSDCDYGSRDRRCEDWAQLIIAGHIGQRFAGVRCFKNRPHARDLVLPLLPLQHIDLTGIFSLDGLHEFQAHLAHPKR